MISGIPGTVVQIAASNSDTYALTSAGTVWAVGAGAQGELGNGSTTDSRSTPVEVDFPSSVTIDALPEPMPYDTGLAIDNNGNVWGWGFNLDGELCLGNNSMTTTPVQLPLSGVTLASGAGNHAQYYADGTLYSCGSGEYGQLGDGSFADSYDPVAVQGLPRESIRALTSAFGGSGALLSDGTYWDWGLNNLGQVGDGSTANSDQPVHVSLPASVSMATQGGGSPSAGSTLLILSNGAVVGWGSDWAGQLCDGRDPVGVLAPEAIAPPAGVRWDSVDLGGSDGFAIDSDGRLWACGNDRSGQLGDGQFQTNSLQPEVVMDGVAQVSATASNGAAMT